jgi:hypothetical protein
MNQKIDLFLNATALNRLSCDRQYQVQCLWGYSELASSEASFGSEFHNFAEALERPSTTELNPIEYFTTTAPSQDKALQKLCIHYQTVSPFAGVAPITDSTGAVCLEYKFSFPYIETDAYRIIICGTIDRIDLHQSAVRVIDRKTARNVKVHDVLSEYEMHIQIPFYLWVLKNHLVADMPEDIAKAILNGDIFGQYHGIFLSFIPTKFELGNPIFLTADMETDVVSMIQTAARKAIELHQLGSVLASPTGMAAKICKYCFLRSLCVTKSHSSIHKFLSTQPSKPYDPRKWR